jgi:hypothetical protein
MVQKEKRRAERRHIRTKKRREEMRLEKRREEKIR